MMKFEEFLTEKSDEEKQKRLELEEEVEKLQAELDGEVTLNKVLQSALEGPVISHPCLSSLLPPKVHALLKELAMVEEEIFWLERKVEELKMRLYREKKHTKGWQQKQQRRLQRGNHLLCGPGSPSRLNKDLQVRTRSQNYEELRKERMRSYRRASVGSASELISLTPTGSPEKFYEKPRRHNNRIPKHHIDRETTNEKPNVLSEELIKCLIGICLDINQAPKDREGSDVAQKLSLSCMNSKSSQAKTSFNCKAPLFAFNRNASNLDPYGILPDLDGSIRDIGPYKDLIQITRSSLDINHFTECLPAARKLRVLMDKLSNVDLTFLTYKQKLAFWINIYNACIMHAFLEHGLPSTQEKLLALMNKAALNVGGIVLNALAIEHFILRHPTDSTSGPTYQKEMLLRHAYGLGYPEPNVTFALCRGSWSSPALRVYTSHDVVNELERAKVEYLEASVGVTSKRKILVPKLLQWHMKDFADDMGSLLEWIYSQLPRSGSLKRLIMECLNGEMKTPVSKMAETQPYESEFRYLLPL
ncbi:Protein of unknown function, DUF547 [Melia azedarach]|uniref:Uncharacterized protein n=1 Tax=Melia azedarach TaxID=155640 RepID=A0ACC1Y9C7_MELAZ|nr:Protein of unknown function, DUF547 [Melia azedarach]